MTRRIAALITAVLLVATVFAAPALASPGDEASFVSLVNSERADRGLKTLSVYWDLVDDARAHAGVMADADQIFHSSNLAGVTTGWAALGENVGVGPTVATLHAAFMNSTGHRDNILGDWDSMGVGVTFNDSGYMFVTVLFMKSATPAPAPAPVPAPAPYPHQNRPPHRQLLRHRPNPCPGAGPGSPHHRQGRRPGAGARRGSCGAEPSHRCLAVRHRVSVQHRLIPRPGPGRAKAQGTSAYCLPHFPEQAAISADRWGRRQPPTGRRLPSFECEQKPLARHQAP